MAISPRVLAKVQDVPEVKTAVEARDQAAAVSREAYQAWADADAAVDRRQAELEEVVVRALDALRREA